MSEEKMRKNTDQVSLALRPDSSKLTEIEMVFDKDGRSFKSKAEDASANTKGFNSSKTNNAFPSRSSTSHWHPRARESNAFSSNSKSAQPVQPLRPLKKDNGIINGSHEAEKFQSTTKQKQGIPSRDGQTYRSNSTVQNANYKFRPRQDFSRNKDAIELARGPRASMSCLPKLSTKDKLPCLVIQREKYNLESFQTKYRHAKFYVIKSFSEDDIHKCIKYDVWSSTTNGNKKLDAGFCEAEAKASGTGTKCPVFLFFSVNSSGQFVGAAEMTGPVDFKKNMNFWQLDRWNGFFPVKWHIVKDIPNRQLQHIILANNDNEPVTHTRDCHEIGLEEGLKMLTIFKNHPEKTSILDDFNFYEDREKLLKLKRASTPASQADGFEINDLVRNYRAGETTMEKERKTAENYACLSTLIGSTKNLSLNSQPLKNGVARLSHRSFPSTSSYN